jgi:putative endonuclease
VSADRRRSLGSSGEALAASWYTAAGYRIVDRNWRCRDGELDLVVTRPGVIVFCEVKTRRSSSFGLPAEAVTSSKQRRIRGLAARWLADHRSGAAHVRFDVASVCVDGAGRAEVEVISDAF